MIPPTIADEYPLLLSTGETIQVAEIDAERSPALANESIHRIMTGILQNCCYVPREVIIEAQGGYDKNLKPLLRAQPAGCMIKSEPAQCRLMHECAMASGPVCTLHNVLPGRHALPICWEFSPPPMPDFELRSAAIELGSVIGHAWRRGMYVFLVME